MEKTGDAAFVKVMRDKWLLLDLNKDGIVSKDEFFHFLSADFAELDQKRVCSSAHCCVGLYFTITIIVSLFLLLFMIITICFLQILKLHNEFVNQGKLCIRIRLVFTELVFELCKYQR